MGSVYVVVSIKNGAELEACEVYAGVQHALGRAFALAHFASIQHPEWMIHAPNEEATGPDGSMRWVFLDTSKNYVAVHYKKIQDAIPSRKDPLEPLKNLNTLDYTLDGYRIFNRAAPQPPSILDGYQYIFQPKPRPADDPLDRNLPAGWTYGNKPATMDELLDYPHDIRPTSELSESQKWALVTARIQKRMGFSMLVPGIGTFVRMTALHEIGLKTTIAQQIVNIECEWLDRLREEQMDVEDSSSEESSEEEY